VTIRFSHIKTENWRAFMPSQSRDGSVGLPDGAASALATALKPDRYGVAYGLSTAGFHRIAYTDWGPLKEEAAVLCLHGLTRQGRDFDYLAATLAGHGRRVVCPDLPGRGRSDRLPSAFHYVFPQHCADAAVMIAATSAQVDWVGTSIGGLIGIVLAGLPGSPIRRLVINDIGPSVQAAAAFRICEKLAYMPQHFETFDDALEYFRTDFSTYGDLEDHHWAHIAHHSIEWTEEHSRYRMLFDRNIAYAFNMFRYYSMPLWHFWKNIKVPILILAGEKSDFLPLALANEMRSQNANARLLPVPGVGHMPMLMQPDQIIPVVEFLLEHETV
jgi:pimeloyl-ACP methyl ester carboxylesterase